MSCICNHFLAFFVVLRFIANKWFGAIVFGGIGEADFVKSLLELLWIAFFYIVLLLFPIGMIIGF
jgi:hypothetical protein